MNAALRRLAIAHGIAPEYHDIWGARHCVQDDVLRALLAAMHVPSDTDAAVETGLRQLERERWRETIAPMTVVRTRSRPWRTRVHMPRGCVDATLAWRIVGEGGDVRERPIDRARVATVEHADLDGARMAAVDVELAFDLPPGYYRVTLVADDDALGEGTLAVAPAACYRPSWLAGGRRSWGATVQLYGLRSERNWGIGDFTDLARFVAQWGEEGAAFVGVNPLHALFPHDPAHASPYSPSSRLFLNPLYLDVEAIPEFRDNGEARRMVESSSFRTQLETLRTAPLVDYVGVAAAKQQILEALYAEARHPATANARRRWTQFEGFKAAGGEALRRHVLFEALQEHFHRANPAARDWRSWPVAYRDPEAAAVQRFADAHRDRVEWFAWLQWQASIQRAAVAAQARTTGLEIGLYTDLAVSVDRGGAEAWANQGLYAIAAGVGAPPDAFNAIGQDWGLPPMIPRRLRAAGYAPFIDTLRANMRDAGALRIDHVMGLRRLYWVPPGGKASQGSYVDYPFDALVGLLALESQRHRCLVVGEDLGTVLEEVRHALAVNGILSYRVLLFERDARGDFKPPRAYPEPALATASTHDLPTLAGWWRGDDLRLRAAHGQLGDTPDLERRVAQRIDDRGRLLDALHGAGLLPEGTTRDPQAAPSLTPSLACSIQCYLATTPSALMAVQPEDVFGVAEQANLPGTTDAYPNWRRKLPLAVELQRADPRFAHLAAGLRAERPNPPRDHALPPPTFARRSSPRLAKPAVPLPPGSVPRSTYRVQLHRDFTFNDVTALVPYFAALGVSHLYCSPYLRARPGSRHGYDIVDHRALNPEIGSRDDFERMVDALARHGMSHICDIVPNHMAVFGGDNAWWMDVMENGPASAYADFFDIDWTPPDVTLRDKVLVPVLGEAYGTVLERGELRLVFEPDGGMFVVRYFDHRFPLDPREYPQVLDAVLAESRGTLGAVLDDELRSLVRTLRALPSRSERDATRVAERRHGSARCKTRLAALAREGAHLGEAIARTVRQLNGSSSTFASRDALHALLEAQAFRLAYWRVASDEINYRRFFDVNELAALRMDSDEVFVATHDFVLELAAQGKIGGLRIDHPDGLYDPARYLERLQARYRELVARRAAAPPTSDAGIYVVLEKISAPHEQLPPTWPVHGDTGYGFANAMNALLVDPTARSRIERVWHAFVGNEARDFESAAYEGKRAIMRGALAAGLTTLAGLALQIARADRRTRDFTFSALRHALGETVAWFPVYRTYISARGTSAQDRRYIDWAVTRARRMSRAADESIFDFVRALLLGAPPADAAPALAQRFLEFAMRFQQYTAPVAAKGVEDTAFYTCTRLVSLNDVGGDPSRFGMTRRAFHRSARERCLHWPSTLVATSTHDNKRSEDVRARIDVISERPAVWRLAVRRWSRLNRSHRREVDGVAAPSRNDEYLLYQTLVGSFPAADAGDDALATYRERIERYMIKAAREAKVRTSWVAVNHEYEGALKDFIGALLASRQENPFLQELRLQLPAFAWFGLLNSLSLTLVKLTGPGVPDTYQGNEMLDLSLVDPDNRRRVDFDSRRSTLAAMRELVAAPPASIAEAVRGWFSNPYDGRAKLWLIHRALAFRNQHAALVAGGDYLALAASGAHARHVLAFARRHRDEVMIVIAGRLFASLGLEPGALPLGDPAWADAALDVGFLPDDTLLTNALTNDAVVVAGGRLRLSAIFATFPGALLSCSTARPPAR